MSILFEAACGDALALFGAPVSDTDPQRRAESVFADIAGRARGLLWAEQVHGSVIASFADEPGTPITGVHRIGRCDGLITDRVGIALSVWTADCVPVLLAGGGVIAAVHAGWRGCASGIAVRAVSRFESEYGVPPGVLEVRLGPAVGACHYPVGNEVVDELETAGVARDAFETAPRNVDLRAFLRCQLAEAGLAGERVIDVGGCTACDPTLASYRRDGHRAGRQASVIVL